MARSGEGSRAAVRRLWTAWVLVTLLSMIATASAANASPGDNDATFSGDGVAKISAGSAGLLDRVVGAVRGPNGTLVVAANVALDQTGRLGLARFTSDHRLDRSFGKDGRVVVGRDGFAFVVRAIARHRGGYVLTGAAVELNGSGTSEIFVARFTGAGRIDTDFGDRGIRLVGTTAPLEIGLSIAVDRNDGGIVVGAISDARTLVVRLTAQGRRDRGFSADGLQRLDGGFNLGFDDSVPVTVQRDGRIVVASRTMGATPDSMIWRLLADGTLDTRFSDDGQTSVDVGSLDDSPYVLAMTGPRILLGAECGDGACLIALRANGTLDTGFHGSGIVGAPVVAEHMRPTGIAVSDDGTITVSNDARFSTGHQWAAFQVSSTGVYNDDFGGAGLFLLEVESSVGPSGIVARSNRSTTLVGTSLADVALVPLAGDGASQLATPRTFNLVTVRSQLDLRNSTRMASRDTLAVGTIGLESLGGRERVAVIRLTEAGDRRRSFGSDGIATFGLPASQLRGRAIATRNGGASVVAAIRETGSGVSLVLFGVTSTGSLDTSIGTNGRLSFPLSTSTDWDGPIAMSTDSSGRVLVAAAADGTVRNTLVVRLAANGQMDAAFGVGGMTTVDTSGFGGPVDIETLATGGVQIVEAGAARIIRLSADGQLDTSFNATGILALSSLSIPSVEVGAVRSNGTTLVASRSLGGATVSRIASDGVLDTTFSADGSMEIPEGSQEFFSVRDLDVQSDGRVVVLIAGSGPAGTDAVSTVWRIGSTGTLDTDFGAGGRRSLVFASLTTYGQSLDATPEGLIVTGLLRSPIWRGFVARLRR